MVRSFASEVRKSGLRDPKVGMTYAVEQAPGNAVQFKMVELSGGGTRIEAISPRRSRWYLSGGSFSNRVLTELANKWSERPLF